MEDVSSRSGTKVLHNAFVQGLLLDLRDAVWNLKREKAELQHAVDDAVMQLNEQKKEATTVKELAEHLCNNARLKKIERERRVLFMLCVALAIVLLAPRVA
ncbi:hypothetical protein C2845_PM01G14880 [Panicum miliaceum]|uniref:Uncharacterized protein n=1 Tax=Panicum miliaceum TaxID=4540 RepID=A0A3L6TSA3_PANMI|nr:hypothetical protein C2845_PM01G14880 [Panicum miliaceum]